MRFGAEGYRTETINLPATVADKVQELAELAGLTDEEMLSAIITLEVWKKPTAHKIPTR